MTSPRIRIVARSLLTLVLASVAVFAVSRALPQTPMEVYLQQHGADVTPESVAALRRQWGLEGTWPEQYFTWVSVLLRGDWGTSLLSGTSIAAELWQRLPLSLGIGLGGLAGAAMLAYPLGMLAATRGGIAEWVTRGLTVLAQAVPSLVVALLVITALGVQLRWVSFYTLTGVAQVIAPAALVTLYTVGQLSRIVAHAALALREEPFVRAMLGRGFDLSAVLWRDGRRQVLYALVAALIAKMSWVIGGTAIVEYVFAVPGISFYVITSIQNRDYFVIQSYLMLMVVWMTVTHLILDAVLRALDPRTRA